MTECLYQSSLWKTIQTTIYGKKSTEIEIFEKKYFCLIKEKKIWFLTFQRYQILGIILPDNDEYIKSELWRIKEELKKKENIISLQLWCINEFARFHNDKKLSETFKEEIKEKRLKINQELTSKFWLKIAFRENMPVSNIVYNVQKEDQILLEEMHDSCKTKVKRAMRKNIAFKIISSDEELETFYQDWEQVSGKKWFGIIPKEQYYKLVHYLNSTNQWCIFVTEIDNDIVWWSIILFNNDTYTYLYGFWNRKYQNIGGHHFLKFKIFQYAREKQIQYVDAMWWAPTGFPDHHLKGVSDFKESLWWEKIEYYGNFDLVLNPFTYWIFKQYKKIQNWWKNKNS